MPGTAPEEEASHRAARAFPCVRCFRSATALLNRQGMPFTAPPYGYILQRLAKTMETDSARPRQTADALQGMIPDARRVELELVEELTDDQMLGARRHFVEPPIWEIGHVGWFQEYWILRHLDGASPLLSGS